MKQRKDYLAVAAMILMCVATIPGILSTNFTHAYDFVNQYGQTVSMYGYGLYAHETYFNAPINIGTDWCILVVLVPVFLYTYIQYCRKDDTISRLRLISVYAISCYYGASASFGIVYNRLFLVYVAVFTCTLFGMFRQIANLHWEGQVKATKGRKVFLLVSGIALLVAWLPDVIPTIINGGPFSLIGVSTTNITYVLDMGVISPLCFACLYLLVKKKPMGALLLAILLKACIIVGVLMVPQTICQIASGAEIPLPALLTKSLAFVLLGGFAYHFNKGMYLELENKEIRKGKKRVWIVVGIIVAILAGLVLYWRLPVSPYKNAFQTRMEKRMEQGKAGNEVCQTEEIAALPEPLQRYCSYIGLTGTKKRKVARIQFSNTDFVMDTQSGKSIKMDYDLWLFTDDLYRNAFCSASMMGIPFEGVDYMSEEGEGGMKGFLGKSVQLFDEHNAQGYRAGLISLMAEAAAFSPSALLSPYISYEPIDSTHVKATISYNKVSGSGIFTINEEGAITQFYSDERQMESINGVDTMVGWRCDYGKYEEKDGRKQMTSVAIVKILPDKEVTYFAADDIKVSYPQ